MNKLPPRPWTVLQHNADRDVKYKPVDLLDADGACFLRVGDNKRALALANGIVAAFELVDSGIEAADEVVKNWSRGDLAGAVNNLEGWADEAREILS